MNRVQLILQNKHTTIAAVVYVLSKFAAVLGAIWIPQHKEQFEQTANAVEALAVGWGLVMAGDAKPTNGN